MMTEYIISTNKRLNQRSKGDTGIRQQMENTIKIMKIQWKYHHTVIYSIIIIIAIQSRYIFL